MKNSILLIVCFLIQNILLAQDKIMRSADKAYQEMRFSTAAALYQQVLAKQPGNMTARQHLADTYRRLRDNRNAEKWYAELADAAGAEPENYLHYAQALAANGNYSRALVYFQKFESGAPADKRSKSFVRAYRRMSDFYADSAAYRVYFLSINSPQADFSPAFYGNELVFVSARNAGGGIKKVFGWNETPFLNLYAADTTSIRQLFVVNTAEKRLAASEEKRDNRLTANDSRTLGYPATDPALPGSTLVHPFSPALNTRWHEGPAAFFSPDSLILTRNNLTPTTGIHRLKLYTAVLKAGKWTESQEFPFNSEDFSVGHPALSPDKKTLYFISDMPGGLGGTDLYRTVWQNNVWSKPENLASLNTEGNEMFPFADASGKLYFASDGWGGLGGLDVFVSENEGNNFKLPVNLGAPINSFADDFGLICNKGGRSGYFSSNRHRNENDDDIYRFVYQPVNKSEKNIAKLLSEKNTVLNGKVFSEKDKAVLENVRVIFKDQNSGKIFETRTNKNGTFSFNLPENCTAFTLTATQENCGTNTLTRSLAGQKKVVLTENISLLCLGDVVRLENVYYNSDQFTIRPDAARQLDNLLAALQKYPEMHVEIRSHTDSRGDAAANKQLSEKRAKAVVAYLVSRGIAADRLRAAGYGESLLLNGCKDDVNCPEADHQRNRRTEFKVLAVE
jgi:outer membrane protein OmpA-like peptidoglycan-associated protein